MRRGWITVVAAVGALAAPVARAGIVAAVDVPVGGTSVDCPTQTDIALIDPATGARSPLPAGINTSQAEIHPSINSLGTRLVFARVDVVAGTTRIIATDLGTGQQADLFGFFETQQLQPTTPSLTPDSGSVLTGTPLTPTSGSQFAAVETRTSLANFPGGPFVHTSSQTGAQFNNAGRLLAPTERSDGLIASTVAVGSNEHIVLDMGGGVFRLASGDHAALSDATTNVVVFQHLSGNFNNETLAFLPVPTLDTAATVNLPPLINPDHYDELNPAFTPDGRYLGFVRYSAGGDHHVRLFVFDTATQTLLNSSGIDLGALPGFACAIAHVWPFLGGLSLRQTFVLTASSVTLSGVSGLLSFQLLQGSGIGILVQRIVGHHRLFGHAVPTLKTIGRVPFGRFKRGHHKVHWNLRVNGRRLTMGHYLVTPRLVSRSGVVLELGKPHPLWIR